MRVEKPGCASKLDVLELATLRYLITLYEYVNHVLSILYLQYFAMMAEVKLNITLSKNPEKNTQSCSNDDKSEYVTTSAAQCICIKFLIFIVIFRSCKNGSVVRQTRRKYIKSYGKNKNFDLFQTQNLRVPFLETTEKANQTTEF